MENKPTHFRESHSCLGCVYEEDKMGDKKIFETYQYCKLHDFTICTCNKYDCDSSYNYICDDYKEDK